MQPLALAVGGLKAVGTLVSAAGQEQAGKYNARVQEAQAEDELRTGAAEELAMRSAARRQIGAQAAGLAESGFAPGTGSALTALEESLISRELDALNIERGAFGRAQGLRQRAGLSRYEGRLAMNAGLINAAAQAADSAANVISAGG